MEGGRGMPLERPPGTVSAKQGGHICSFWELKSTPFSRRFASNYNQAPLFAKARRFGGLSRSPLYIKTRRYLLGLLWGRDPGWNSRQPCDCCIQFINIDCDHSHNKLSSKQCTHPLICIFKSVAVANQQEQEWWTGLKCFDELSAICKWPSTSTTTWGCRVLIQKGP